MRAESLFQAQGVALTTNPFLPRSESGVVRVHELARELGVRVSVVLQAARAAQIRYLRTASSPVPDADADTIRAHVRGAGVARPESPAAPAAWAAPVASTAPAASPEELAAAAALGLDPSTTGAVDPEMAATAAALGVEFSGGRATYRQPGRPARGASRAASSRSGAFAAPSGSLSAPPAGMAAQIHEQWPTITPAKAERLAAAYAAKNVTVEAARPYWEGGLGPFDTDAISQCISNGLQPADLALLVDGRSVVNRLRSGEPVQLLLLQLPR